MKLPYGWLFAMAILFFVIGCVQGAVFVWALVQPDDWVTPLARAGTCFYISYLHLAMTYVQVQNDSLNGKGADVNEEAER